MITRERRRGFQPPWYWVRVLSCECGSVTIRESWRGSTPPGAVRCPTAKHNLSLTGEVIPVSK